MKIQLLCGLLVTLLLTAACGQDKGSEPKKQTPVYVKMTLNGNPELHVTAKGPSDQSAGVSARITSQDLSMSGQTIAKNTLIIGATEIIDQASGKVKTLSISVPDITAPGTYQLLSKGGIFVYSDASNGMSNIRGYHIAEPGDGSCTIVITKIGNEPVATSGRLAKGSFSVTMQEDGTTLKGTFNGGIPE